MGEEEHRQNHVEAMARVRQLELQLAMLSRELGDTRIHSEHEIKDIKEELAQFCQWMQDDSVKSAWFYQAEADLKQLVESNQWLKTTKRLVVWLVGVVVGTTMAWNAVAIWIRENL